MNNSINSPMDVPKKVQQNGALFSVKRFFTRFLDVYDLDVSLLPVSKKSLQRTYERAQNGQASKALKRLKYMACCRDKLRAGLAAGHVIDLAKFQDENTVDALYDICLRRSRRYYVHVNNDAVIRNCIGALCDSCAENARASAWLINLASLGDRHKELKRVAKEFLRSLETRLLLSEPQEINSNELPILLFSASSQTKTRTPVKNLLARIAALDTPLAAEVQEALKKLTNGASITA